MNDYEFAKWGAGNSKDAITHQLSNPSMKHSLDIAIFRINSYKTLVAKIIKYKFTKNIYLNIRLPTFNISLYTSYIY